MASRLGIDVGANSTDLLLFDEQSGQTRVLKTSAGANPVAAVLGAVDRLVADAGVNPAEITDIRVGSAEASRIVRDGSGARVGLVVTEGFEHILHLARGRTPPRLNGWMSMAEPPVLAELAHTVGVSERIDARGQIGQPLDESQARQAIQTLLGAGVDAIVISLLHAYANPLHEKRLRDIARDVAPDLAVTISSSVLPEFREYERTVVAVLCAYLRPGLDSVFTELAGGLREHGLSPDLTIMRADGGGVSVGRAIAAPAHTILASEAGAVCGAAAAAAAAGHPNAISLDIGSRATSVALIRDGRPAIVRRAHLSGLPLAVPAVESDGEAVGGSTRAEVYGGGLLGLGGRDDSLPSVSDANVVLGRMPNASHTEQAEEAVGRLARELRMDLYETAQAIIDLADETVLGALRRCCAAHRADPAGLALVATGGAGPSHANAIAQLAGAGPVIVPRTPGVMSALGFLVGGPRNEFFRSLGHALNEIEPGQLAETYGTLGRKAREWLAAEGVDDDSQDVRFEAELRYGHDGRLVGLPVDPDRLADDGLLDLRAAFDTEHMRRFGHASDRPAEIVTLRAIGLGPAPATPFKRHDTAGPDPADAEAGEQQVWFDGAFGAVPVYDRDKLRAGHRLPGPALVVQSDTTTMILPGCTGSVDGYLNIVITSDRPGAGGKDGRT